MNNKKRKLGFMESCRILGKALKISIKTKTAISIIISLIGFPMAFLPMFISLTLKNFSDMVQELFGTGTTNMMSVLSEFLVLSVLYIIQLLYTSTRSYFTKSDSLRIQRYIKEHILRCSCNVKYKYIENYDDFRDKIRFADSDAGLRVANSIQTIILWIQNVITFVSILVVLLNVDIWVVVILITACIPAVILSYFQKDEEYRNKAKWIHESNMAINYCWEAIWQNSINEVRFFGLYQFIKNKWRDMMDRYLVKKNKLTAKHVLFNSIADIFRNSVYIVILLITASKIFENPTIGIGTFMLVFTMAGQLQEVTAKIFVGAAQFFSDISYMKDFFDLDELDYEKRDPKAQPRKHFDLFFNGVSFTYPNTDREVLHDISVRINEGEKVAIVGENGSGKSTFVNLLCAMYEPDSGSITMGGEDIFGNLSATRCSISAVFQDFARYEATIRENVVISDADRQIDDVEIRKLSEKTGAWEFIETQKKQLDEVVGLFSETGNNLSGGQWQKIAITRCVYRDSAKVMVLDEPTAALDPVAEAELYRNFAALTGDRTTILISHRLGITNLVDRILVFDDGRIVEDGDHRTLMAQNGLYARMYNAQAQWYVE